MVRLHRRLAHNTFPCKEHSCGGLLWPDGRRTGKGRAEYTMSFCKACSNRYHKALLGHKYVRPEGWEHMP